MSDARAGKDLDQSTARALGLGRRGRESGLLRLRTKWDRDPEVDGPELGQPDGVYVRAIVRIIVSAGKSSGTTRVPGQHALPLHARHRERRLQMAEKRARKPQKKGESEYAASPLHTPAHNIFYTPGGQASPARSRSLVGRAPSTSAECREVSRSRPAWRLSQASIVCKRESSGLVTWLRHSVYSTRRTRLSTHPDSSSFRCSRLSSMKRFACSDAWVRQGLTPRLHILWSRMSQTYVVFLVLRSRQRMFSTKLDSIVVVYGSWMECFGPFRMATIGCGAVLLLLLPTTAFGGKGRGNEFDGASA